MLKAQLTLLLLATGSLLTGCGEVVVFGHTVREGHASSEAKVEPIPAATLGTTSPAVTKTVASPSIQRVKAVTLSLTPQATEKVANDSRFNAQVLLDTIKNELQSRKLLDAAGSEGSSTAEISIDGYALNPTTNFVLFGSSTYAGTLSGHLVVHDEHGNVLPNRRIEAQARVSIPENGEAENPLRSLYREFAGAVVSGLTSTQVESTAPPGQPPQ